MGTGIRQVVWSVSALVVVALQAAVPPSRQSAPSAAGVVPGLEVLLEERLSLIQGKRVGLVTNHTGVDRQLRHAADLLKRASGVRLTAIFAPEHGFRGIAQAGDRVVDTVDERTGVRVYSIYGGSNRPTAEMLKEVDVLVFDIQDAGVRFYTYISTMGECMEAAADKGIPYVVLDRPNALADIALEGGMIDLARFKSFVGAYPVPIRYGLTIGELASFVRDTLGKKVDLTVVPMKNYRRTMWYDETGLPWLAPSPNLPTTNSAMVYPGMCLFEGTNLSEGRGTMFPFENIGAPWLDAYRLVDDLRDLKLDGVAFRPVSFTPSSSKYQGQACQGIHVHVVDRQSFRPVKVALNIISVIRRNHPRDFQWRESSIDRLTGSDALRTSMARGVRVEEILSAWEAEVKPFDAARRKYFLYRD
ncbi:MAG: exo-beta-N-acetylmuramidase NamZ domain-containing protein [Vicinamibacterales bacterium]